MKTIFLKIYDKITSFFMNLNSTEAPGAAPEDYYVNCLIMKIKPVLYDGGMTDAEKVDKLRRLIDRYDFLEY